MRRFIYFIGLALLALLVDFFSKAYVHSHIPLMDYASSFYPYGGIGVFHHVLGIDFSINHVANMGAAWGMFASYPSLLLIFRSLLISVLIYLFIKQPAQRLSLLLIITGALGNIMDYFIYGHVVDMFLFRFWGYAYPVFNVADSLIFCGVAWLLIGRQFRKGDAECPSP